MEYSSKLACSLALAFAMAAALVAAPCAAQNSPQDYVELHNASRAEVGVGPVSWDDTLATYAQSYADQRRGDCKLVNSGGQYGENIFTDSGAADCTAADAVNFWVSQKKYYDYDSNSCSENWSESCGLYTQVVWRNTTAIGCACDVCDNDRGVFTICSYNPGSVDGQRPY